MSTPNSENFKPVDFKVSRADEAIMKNYGVFGAEAESAVIGAMMIDPELALLGGRVLKAEYFLLKTRRSLFEVIDRLVETKPTFTTDPVLILETLRAMNYTDVADNPVAVLEYVGYLARATTRQNFLSWCEIIVRAWSRRRMAALANKAVGDAMAFDTELETVFDQVEEAIRELRAVSTQTISETAEEILDRKMSQPADAKPQVVPTGFNELDRMLKNGGLKLDDYTIVAARPFKGKTTISGQIATNNVLAGRGVLWFPFEMTGDLMIDRMVDMRGGISYDAEQDGLLIEADYKRRRAAQAELATPNLRMVKTSVVTMPMIWKEVAWCRSYMPVPLSMIVIDHLGLVSSSRQFKNRYEEVGYHSRQLKLLASEYKVPVLCPHQINREGEAEGDSGERMDMRHLRNSGDVEQDADNIFILQTPDNETDMSYELELTGVKQRKGRAFTVRFRYDKPLGIFEDLTGTGKRGVPLIKNKKARKVANNDDKFSGE